MTFQWETFGQSFIKVLNSSVRAQIYTHNTEQCARTLRTAKNDCCAAPRVSKVSFY